MNDRALIEVLIFGYDSWVGNSSQATVIVIKGRRTSMRGSYRNPILDPRHVVADSISALARVKSVLNELFCTLEKNQVV